MQELVGKPATAFPQAGRACKPKKDVDEKTAAQAKCRKWVTCLGSDLTHCKTYINKLETAPMPAGMKAEYVKLLKDHELALGDMRDSVQEILSRPGGFVSEVAATRLQEADQLVKSFHKDLSA
eukprot:5525555-Alexandrium_andersonii.AAC.1